MSEPILRVSGVGKSFRIYAHESRRILGWLTGRPSGFVDNWVLRDISFDIGPGEGMGILGRNGAGKSTLLKVIAGTTAPTEGSISISGRVNVLELGIGFNPEFTGRENALHSLSMMGYDRAVILDQMSSIEAFADIGEYFDRPMRVYSSGMYMRVAFAAATTFRPDILIVDEAMSVGDAFFQAKCFDRISQLREAGTALLFVSHSAGDVVKHCERAIFLDKGRVELIGTARDVTNAYLDHLFGKGRAATAKAPSTTTSSTGGNFQEGSADIFYTRPLYRKEEYRWGSGGVRICDYLISSGGKDFPPLLNTGDRVTVTYKVAFDRDIEQPLFGLQIKTLDGMVIYGTNSDFARSTARPAPAAKGETRLASFNVPLALNTGSYLISVGVTDLSTGEAIPLDRRYDSILVAVDNPRPAAGQVDLDAEFSILA